MDYRTIFEQSPIGLILLDETFEDCNELACQLLACQRDDILGHLLLDFSPPRQPAGRDSKKSAQEYTVAALSGAPQAFPWLIKRKDGVLIDTELSMKTIEIEGRVFILLGMHDITERKLAEEALRESEALLSVIFNESFQLMGLMKPDGTIIKLNRTADESIRTDVSLELNKPFWETSWWSHSLEEQKRLRKAISRAAQGKFVRYETTHPKPEGGLMYVDFSLQPVKDDTGKVVLLVPEGRDITNRRRAEEAIRQLNQDLEARVIERTRELELANRELEAFTSSVSHDLRAPLRAIDGFSEALLEDYAGHLDEEGRTYLRYLQEGSRDMNELIEGLLKLSRSTRGEMALEPVDLSSLVTVVVAELRQAEPKRQMTVHIAQNLKANADPRLLKDVMANLLGNAWKYTAQTADASIKFGAEQQDNETVFFVRDNGAGFDMAYADKLFLPFQRLHKTGEFSGTGIGLATVQRIIHRHGGRIWAKSVVEEGASFYFTLGEEGKDHG